MTKYLALSILFVSLLPALTSPTFAKEPQSICYGSTNKGRLENGTRLPLKGKNFSTYSRLGSLLGRTAVHSQVKIVVVEAYEKLATNLPEKVFVYGETGWMNGGSFKPHKTHQNGLSVDFMIPIVDRQGKSIPLPTHALNQWGYKIEFDSQGKFKDYTIDFEAMAGHLYFLDQIARKHGVKIRRVYFDPELRKKLQDTQYWPSLSENITFSKMRSWVRHDDHYHVDFDIPCRPF